MAKIEVDINYDQDITIFKVTGELKAGELLNSTTDYNEGKVTRGVLVDFTDASWVGLSAEDLRKNTAAGSKHSRPGGKSAFVFSSDIEFGVGRMVEAFATIEKFSSELRMFRSMDEAYKWLREEDDDGGVDEN